MPTTSDDGDRTCPLCTEEMDLTDQQLKPCKCGYEICVWCWHHIMDMAGKDGTEGRCPACRSPYDKEKIVAAAASCGRMAAKINGERRSKSQKAKLKTSVEAGKNLSSVRVVQRNLVYIIGLPSNLCDESVLERKQYFGQYGKVLNVSITRPTGATQQASSTNTFCVYITYARKEEAVRCIQAVHDFVLEGKPLRACFGTTKYCNNWLRNMSCSIPDCMYLHELGSQEDSFTKDEIISAYTRTRVPQIASINMQRRSGNVLPPPLDDTGSFVTVSCTKTRTRTAANHTTGQAKFANSSAGKSTSLPAAASWGARASNCQQVTTNMTCSETPVKQKLRKPDSSSALSLTSATTKQASAWTVDDITMPVVPDGSHTVHMDGLSRLSVSSKSGVGRGDQSFESDVSSEAFQEASHDVSGWDDDVATSPNMPAEKHMVDIIGRSRRLEPLRSSVIQDFQTSESGLSLSATLDSSHSSPTSESCSSRPLAFASKHKKTDLSVERNCTNLVAGTSTETCDRKLVDFSLDRFSRSSTDANGFMQNLCSRIPTVNIDEHQSVNAGNLDEDIGSVSNVCSTGLSKTSVSRLQRRFAGNKADDALGSGTMTHLSEISSTHTLRGSSDCLKSQKQVFPSTGNEIKHSVLAADFQKHILSDVKSEISCSSYSNHSISHTNFVTNGSLDYGVGCTDTLISRDSWPSNANKPLLPLGKESTLFPELDNLNNSSMHEKILKLPERYFTDKKVKSEGIMGDEDNIDKVTSVDLGENSIISDILDFDPWDDSLSAANNLVRLLGKTSKEDGSRLLSNSLKSPNSNQSRFTFARQDNQFNHLDSSTQISSSSLQDSCRNSYQNEPQFSSFLGHSGVISNTGGSDENADVSWQQISPPPGFSLVSKAPSPGFSFLDRRDQIYEAAYSENNLNDISSHGNQYQIQQSDNITDVEFIDPAILAVGRGQIPQTVNNFGLAPRSPFSSQFSNIDPRLQLLMQQSASSLQNQRISYQSGDRLLHLNDIYIQSLQSQRTADHIRERFLFLNNTYTTSQHLLQNISSQSPYAHLSLQHPGNSHILSNQWDGRNDVPTVNGTFNNVNMAEILREERFGLLVIMGLVTSIRELGNKSSTFQMLLIFTTEHSVYKCLDTCSFYLHIHVSQLFSMSSIYATWKTDQFNLLRSTDCANDMGVFIHIVGGILEECCTIGC